jgi:hypothetical protein
MRQNPIEKTWRKHLVDKLQDRYGLSPEQARFRAHLWLQWMKEPPFLDSSDSDAPEERLASSLPPRSRSSESKSAKAKRL